MKLYFMKQSAVDYIKSNMTTLYVNYYREKTNQWIYDLFDYDPFELFMDIPEFSLAPVSDKKGEVDLENCKIFYSKLINISESQASDERLWAGLCHSTFYHYTRARWNYPNLKFKTPEKDAGALVSRFFFSSGTRGGFYRNTLAKYWWVGHGTYQAHGANRFELLDALGPEDFTSKVTDLFYSNTFASNPTITRGICKAWRIFAKRGIKLSVKEYFRPALQYLNALGGGILLDVLSEDEIKDVFFDYVYQLYSKERPNAMIVQTEGVEDVDEEEYNVSDTSDEIKNMQQNNSHLKEKEPFENVGEECSAVIIGERDSEDMNDAAKISKLFGKPQIVTYGCTVSVTLEKSKKRVIYNIPKDKKGNWFLIQKLLLNKKIGDTFKFQKDVYIIEDII